MAQTIGDDHMTFVYFYGNEIVRKEKYGENGKRSAESIILSRLPFVYILTTIKFLLEKEYIDDAKGLIDGVFETVDDFHFKD